MKFINLQTPGQVYHSLFCTSKQSSIQKHAKSGMVQKGPAKFKKLASIKTIPIFLGRGFLSCVCWHFQRPCTWVKHTETTWQGHNKTGAKYHLIQILRGKKWSWGEVTVRGGRFYFVEKYIFDWIQHSIKMKRGPLAREEKKSKSLEILDTTKINDSFFQYPIGRLQKMMFSSIHGESKVFDWCKSVLHKCWSV